jgi:hypothetical protein
METTLFSGLDSILSSILCLCSESGRETFGVGGWVGEGESEKDTLIHPHSHPPPHLPTHPHHQVSKHERRALRKSAFYLNKETEQHFQGATIDIHFLNYNEFNCEKNE